LFEDDLYFELARHANAMAQILRQGVKQAGFKLLAESDSNLLFPILPNAIVEKLKENYDFLVITQVDEKTSAIRLVTSWATGEQDARAFVDTLNECAEQQ
jgi:threonine aldolase